VKPLNDSDCQVLADTLGDSPETVIPTHQLRRGICTAWTAGDPAEGVAAIVQATDLPDEPTGFGHDAEALASLLPLAEGWKCFNVPTACARAVAEIMHRDLGVAVRFYDDIYYVLRQPARVIRHPDVRLLTGADEMLLRSAPPELRGCGFESPAQMLIEGVVAGAIADDQLVAIGHTSALSTRYADVGVYTLKNYRQRSYAVAVASIVAKAVRQQGRQPVWSTGEDNVASHRIAARLGFEEVSRRVYLIPTHCV